LGKPGIAVFAFGVPYNINSNKLIAEIASRKAREIKAPIYTQLDIRINSEVKVEYINEIQGNPPPTLRMARGAIHWAKFNEITELWVCAAKPHLWRCLRDLKYAANESGIKIEIKICEMIKWYSENYWFCPDSTQEFTRSRENWQLREKILQRMPIFLYKFIAS